MNRVLPPGPRSINTVHACARACVCKRAHRIDVVFREHPRDRVRRIGNKWRCAVHRYLFPRDGDKNKKNFSAILLLFFWKRWSITAPLFFIALSPFALPHYPPRFVREEFRDGKFPRNRMWNEPRRRDITYELVFHRAHSEKYTSAAPKSVILLSRARGKVSFFFFFFSIRIESEEKNKMNRR